MKNPLDKRLLREFRSEIGKYVVILILLIASIGMVSGFLVADGSMKRIYDESFEKYNIEDGYFDLSEELTNNQKKRIEENEVTVYKNYFVEETLTNDSTLRIFQNREEVDKVCLMDGRFPKEIGEIAIDRMYAENNQIQIGDEISTTDRSWKVVGYVSLSDYSSLFSNNNDTMFDAVKFGVAVVTKQAFDEFPAKDLTYRYSWIYDISPANETKEHDTGDDLMKAMGKVVTLESFVPQYQNQAIHFTGEDMGSDKAMMTVILYMIIVILAFVFAITISNTISKEAATIGTLRALGYTRWELIRHYLTLPMIVSVIGALIGNALGYTVLVGVVKNMYYGSYSLTKYYTIPSGEAFLKTTIVPFMIMLLVNFVILSYKLTLSPLKFLRRDLRRRKQKKTIHLSKRIPFLSRYRMRIMIQNRSNYLVLFVGIMFANMLLLFGNGLPVVLDHYQENIQKNMLSKYQYLLSVPTSILSSDKPMESMLKALEFSLGTDTDNDTAEKFSVYSLNTTSDICDSEEIILYGIQKDSSYVPIDFKDEGVYISSAFAEKFLLEKGDIIRLKEKYEDDTYKFKVAGIYDYIGGLTIFMPQEELNETFDLEKSYFSGYFSDTEITDMNSEYVGSVIDLDTLTKVSRQLDVSMGSMMYLVDGFAVLIFLVLIYLLSKIVIEKNAQSISMTKILGYNNGEISRLYILATTVIVMISLLVTIWIDYFFLKIIFRQMMLTSMSGWIPLQLDNSVYVKMFVTGIITYAVVAVLEFQKIKKVPMDEALKNVE